MFPLSTLGFAWQALVVKTCFFLVHAWPGGGRGPLTHAEEENGSLVLPVLVIYIYIFCS